jgi:hypothetical protein
LTRSYIGGSNGYTTSGTGEHSEVVASDRVFSRYPYSEKYASDGGFHVLGDTVDSFKTTRHGTLSSGEVGGDVKQRTRKKTIYLSPSKEI